MSLTKAQEAMVDLKIKTGALSDKEKCIVQESIFMSILTSERMPQEKRARFSFLVKRVITDNSALILLETLFAELDKGREFHNIALQVVDEITVRQKQTKAELINILEELKLIPKESI